MIRVPPSRSAGLTTVELLVAVVLLTVIALALSSSAMYSSRLLERSRAELWMAEMRSAELERLRALPWDSLADGAWALPRGTSAWTVEDSAGYRRIFLTVEYTGFRRPLRDSVVAYRIAR